MRWRLRSSEFDYLVLYCPTLVHKVPNSLLKPLQLSVTEYFDPKCNEISTLGYRPVASEQRVKKKWVLDIQFSKNYFKSINVLKRSHNASHTLVDDSLDYGFHENK